MADFKSEGSVELTPHQVAVVEGRYTPLFGNDDPAGGGLAVLDDNSIVEFSHPLWSLADGPAHQRVMPLSLRVSGDSVEYVDGADWDARFPSLGSETELIVARDGRGWWEVLPDGENLHWPGGSVQPIAGTPFQAEALKRMIEYGTVPARGYEAHAAQVGRMAKEIGQLLAEHELHAPPVSVDPDWFAFNDLSEHPWIQKIIGFMPNIHEFQGAGVQLHIQMRDLESGARALNNYQAVQALAALLTECGPIRDGRFDTTLGDHFLRNPNPEYKTPVGTLDLALTYGDDRVPHDWREFSRYFGSPSAGAYHTPAPHTAMDLLRSADEQLRSGAIVSAVRVLGWHTDRIRFDLGTLEICNMGTAGGNLRKLLAAQTLVAKFMVALQEADSRTSNAPQELFGADDTLEARTLQCQNGHINNFKAAIYGKRSKLILPDGSDAVPQREMLNQLIQFTNNHSPVPVAPQVERELMATLQPPPTPDDYRHGTAGMVLADFYKPESPMTGTEALRLAHQVEPELPIMRLLERMALLQAEHVRQWNQTKRKR